MNQKSTIININSLLDLSAQLYESDNESFILKATLLSLMGKLKIVRAIVLIPDNEYEFAPFLIKGNISIGNIKKFELDEFTKIENNSNLKELMDFGMEYAVPIKNSHNFYAVICLGRSLSEIEMSNEEFDYINLISNISANSIYNARNIASYKTAKLNAEHRNQLLATLFEISKDFSQNYSPSQIIKTLTLNLMGQLTVSRFAVFSINDNCEISQVVNRFGEEFGQYILNEFTKCDFAQNVKDMENYLQIQNFVIQKHIQVVVPMFVQGSRKGLMLIGKKMNGSHFTDMNLMFLEAIGNSAMAALENERLFREELEKKKIESELAIALEIQRNLLPDCSPVLKNYEISGKSIPSRHVGGDLYDFIKLDESRYLIAIADVSGKGIPASLIMANFQAALRVLALSGLPLIEIVQKINNILYHNTSADKFVTSFFCIIDENTNKLTYINAGHNPPFLHKLSGEIQYLNEGGLILGFMEHPFEYQVGDVQLENGEYIILYTDGVTEAENIEKEDFGELRLEDFMRKIQTNDTKIIMDSLIGVINGFLGIAPQNDDITLVILNKL
jgi:sigma-B regulation protein RsbU (phosphoserine phosphatase)